MRAETEGENERKRRRAGGEGDPEGARIPRKGGRIRPHRFTVKNRRRCGGCFDAGNGRDKAVAHAGDGLDKLGIFGIVAESVAELADGGVYAVLGIDEDFAGPEPLGDFSPVDELILMGREQDKQLHGLALDAKSVAVAGEFESAAVELKISELIDRTRQTKIPFGEDLDLSNLAQSEADLKPDEKAWVSPKFRNPNYHPQSSRGTGVAKRLG